MTGLQAIVFFEMLIFFGGIMAFCWWQVRLMRRELEASKNSDEQT